MTASCNRAGQEAEQQIETLSDLSDMDMTEFIVEDENEIRQKEKIWETMNHEYLEQQELKRLQLEEAHQVQTSLPVFLAVMIAWHRTRQKRFGRTWLFT